MRFGKIFLQGVFLYASIANAQDVMVDLSVLDDLDAPYKNVSKPLLPVLPKKTEAKVKKSLKPKQEKVTKPIKKLKPKKVVEKVKPLDDDIVVVDFEPVSEPVVAKKEITEPVEAKKAEIQPVKKDVSEEIKLVEGIKDVEKKVMEEIKQPEPEVAERAESVVEKEKSELLISEKKEIVDSGSYISFANDADELNDEQRAKIDAIVANYKNTSKNKIAIYSYNLDNGVDSFKRKRISLNRAVEIRRYLLKKGYKNFSIKVININNTSDKNNMVKLQEI